MLEWPRAHKNRISTVDHLTASDVKGSRGLTRLNGLIFQTGRRRRRAAALKKKKKKI